MPELRTSASVSGTDHRGLRRRVGAETRQRIGGAAAGELDDLAVALALKRDQRGTAGPTWNRLTRMVCTQASQSTSSLFP
jgi:hypothetical protein